MNSLKNTLHQIRNCLGAIQTFLEVVEPEQKGEKIEALHKTCKENLEKIKNLLRRIES